MTFETHKARALRLQAAAMHEEAKAYRCDHNTDMAAFCERMADTFMDDAASYEQEIPA